MPKPPGQKPGKPLEPSGHTPAGRGAVSGSNTGGDGSPESIFEENLVGLVVAGNYQVVKRIGEGGMSVVYRAKHMHLNKEVAIKFLHGHLVASRTNRERFKQEAQAVSKLDHPGVVRIHDFGITEDNRPYIVMDLLLGRSLSDLIRKEPLPPARAVNIFIAIADALAYTHKRGIIHRDLKPSNIVILDNDEVRILDFGIAKLLPHEGSDGIALTQTGEVFGSPLFMSPEQCKGDKLDNRSDIYSMGCLMYQTLTGKPPINGENMLEILYRHMNEMPRSMKDAPQVVPSKLEAIVFKALAKDPRDRFQSMEAMKETLEAFLKSQDTLLSNLITSFSLLKAKRRRMQGTEKVAAFFIAIGTSLLFLSLLIPAGLYVFGMVAKSSASPPDWAVSLTYSQETTSDPISLTLRRGNMIKTLKDRLEQLHKLERLGRSDEIGVETNAAIEEGNSVASSLLKDGRYKDAAELAALTTECSTIVNGADAYSTTESMVLQVRALYRGGEYSRTITLLKNLFERNHDRLAIKTTTSMAMLSTIVGDCQYRTKNYGEALKNLSIAAKQWQTSCQNDSNPDDWTIEYRAYTLSRLGDIHFMQGNFTVALNYYENALTLWQKLESNLGKYDVVHCHYRLAITRANLKQFPQAQEEFKTVLNTIKDHPEIQLLANRKLIMIQTYSSTLRENGDLIDSTINYISAGLTSL